MPVSTSPPSAPSETKKPSRHRYVPALFRYALFYKRLLALSVIVGTIGMLVPFVIPWLIGAAIDHAIAPAAGSSLSPDDRTNWLVWLGGLGIATALIQGVLVYARGHLNVMLGNRIVTRLRSDLFAHLQKLSLHFYTRQRTGAIVSRLLHDVHIATALINGGVVTVGLDLLQLLIAMALLFSISWQLAVACLVVLPFYALTFRVFNPLVRKASGRLHEHYCKLSGNVQEQLSGVALTKTFAAEKRECDKFDRDVEEHHEKVVEQSHFGHMVGAVSEVLVHLGTVIVFAYGGWLAVRGDLTAGDITRFLGYLGIMYGPLRRFAELNMVFQNSLAAVTRVFSVFDIKPRIVEKPDARADGPKRGEIVIDHVQFRYDEDCDETRANLERDDDRIDPIDQPRESHADRHRRIRWAIDGISLHIHAGERIALVGPSGSGKTTLATLLMRLYDPSHGRIVIDGTDLADYKLAALRESIGVVQQDTFAFSGTIRDNIAYARPDADRKAVHAAAVAANAHEFIERLPDGYDTVIGERGITLSGGQRQRLSIARALLKDPKILILDEATSALDTESETLVQQALERLMRGRTCIIIAHRLSTIRNADRIVAMAAGRIVEVGTHDELLSKGGLYARLAHQQSTTPLRAVGAPEAEEGEGVLAVA
jgi:subfamily B ATP-binding cassette protein MsbA